MTHVRPFCSFHGVIVDINYLVKIGGDQCGDLHRENSLLFISGQGLELAIEGKNITNLSKFIEIKVSVFRTYAAHKF